MAPAGDRATGFTKTPLFFVMLKTEAFTKRFLALFACIYLLSVRGAAATELSIPGMKISPGQVIELPIMIDAVDNLAGMKLVLKYDPELLTYQKASKTKHSSSLMHIVNDKKPGTLIIVMAGARGIKGKNFPIFKLVFQVNNKITGKKESKLKITEIQLMSDNLKNVDAVVKTDRLIIIPKLTVNPVPGKKQ